MLRGLRFFFTHLLRPESVLDSPAFLLYFWRHTHTSEETMSQCTLYFDLPGLFHLSRALAEALPGYALAGDPKSGSMSAVKDGESISFYIRGTGIDADGFYDNMMEMYKYYESIATDRPEIKAQLLRHLPMFNASLGVVTEGEMDEEFFLALQGMVGELGGLMLLPPANLYNGKGELVFDVDGKSELADYVISKSSRFFDEKVRTSASGEARRARNNKFLAEQGVPVNENLPAIEGDEDAAIRSKDEVIDRLLALTYSSVYAELARDQSVQAAREGLAWFAGRYGVDALLSPKEKAFVAADAPEEQDVIDYVWRYECLWVAAWALSLIPELSYPEAICDVARLTEIISQFKSRDDIFKKTKLRAKAELLDQTDLIYRYDWACIDAMLREEAAPAHLNGEVVLERHRFLNWLRSYDGVDWDDVQTDT